MNNSITTLHKQSGVVLVVSLIMLLLLTLIGLSGSQVTGMEEKMASNSRDQNLAFQSAEAALRAGEARIESIPALIQYNGANGLLGANNPEPVFNAANTWTDANSFQLAIGNALPAIATEVALPIAQTPTPPRYYIKRLRNNVENINIGGYGAQTTENSLSYFTVTTRGTGANGQSSSQVYLRSYYAKFYN